MIQTAACILQIDFSCPWPQISRIRNARWIITLTIPQDKEKWMVLCLHSEPCLHENKYVYAWLQFLLNVNTWNFEEPKKVQIGYGNTIFWHSEKGKCMVYHPCPLLPYLRGEGVLIWAARTLLRSLKGARAVNPYPVTPSLEWKTSYF